MNKVFELNTESLKELSSFIQSLENKEKYIIEVKRKHRSYEQLKYYFGAILPAVLYFIRDEIKINSIDDLHIYLKEFYAFEAKQEYFKKTVINGKTRYINTFSIDFEKCSQNDINLYLSFIENNLNKLITIDCGNFEDLINEFSNYSSVNTINIIR